MQHCVSTVSVLFASFAQAREEEKRKEMKKYTVKPPKDLRSKFILKMEARKVAEEKTAEDKRKAEEEQKLLVSIDCIKCVCVHTHMCIHVCMCQWT